MAQLQVRVCTLTPGKEWIAQPYEWSLIQVASGSGYWLQGQSRTELVTGAVVLAAGAEPGRVLASCLNGMLLQFFTVMPERLAGLVNPGEQEFFRQFAGRRECYRVLGAENEVALKMKEVCARASRGGLMFRLKLLQLWVEAFGREWQTTEPDQAPADVKERLRVFLQETPPADLLEISFDELAKIIHCTPRHLSRVFYDVAGTSFREKRTEIRLSRARELLATSQSKVVEIAFKSGFKSLSLFNRMFTRRFGISPGRWRQKLENGGAKENSGWRNGKVRLTSGAGRRGRF